MTTAEELFDYAEELFEKENYQGLIDLLPDVVLEEHKNDRLYAAKAQAYDYLNEYNLCMKAAKKALALNPNNARAHNSIGNVFNAKGQYEMAIEEYEKAIENDPKFSFPYYNLGLAYNRLKQDEKAIEAYNEAIKINPKDSDFYYNRASIYLDQRQYEKALIDFENYLRLTEDKTDYYASVAKEKVAEIKKLINVKGYGEIATLVNNIKGLLLYKDECVTHYTSMTVAKTLILDKDSKFRLSEGAYLNDTSEGRELFKYLHLTATPVDGHDTVAGPFAKKPFIGSFVAEGKHDDLTLWRMYGKEAKEEARGWAITLQREQLLKKLQEHFAGDKKEGDLNEYDEFNFYRVAYCRREGKNPFTIPSGKKADEKKLNDYMKGLAVKVEAFTKNRLGNVADKQKLLELLNEIAYLFKSYEYQYEHEIRLVLKGTGIKIFIDMGATPPKVFIKLINIRPVLKKITLGPKVEKSDEWASALFYALDKDGLNPDILISHLPFK